MPVHASGCKTLGIFQSNPITATFWIDHQGFVPGEIIYFNAKVENFTGKTMRGTKVQIIQVRVKRKLYRLKSFYEHVNNIVGVLFRELLSTYRSRPNFIKR